MRRLALIIVALTLASCVDPPRVLQGEVKSYDRAAKIVSVLDELPPRQEVRLSLAGAEVGAEPAPGDRVRVAYRERSGERVALRLANISRQTEIGGKASGKKR